MNTITKTYESNFRERGSRFIGYLFPANTEEEFGEQLDQFKSKYPDASHHCYGWRLNPAQPKEFSSDDGEPSGTAGLPILNQLKSFEVVNAGIVVVRYFGGTKLGKSGLIEAYSLAGQLCLGMADLTPIKAVQFFEVQYPYSEENTVSKLKNDFDLAVTVSQYLEHVTLKIACPKERVRDFEEELLGLEYLGIHFKKLGEHFL